MSRDAATDGGTASDDASADDDSPPAPRRRDRDRGRVDDPIGTVGRLLADPRRTTIKVEHPETGDHLRHFGPQKEGVGLWWKYLGRNKQSVTLDISTEEGKVVFEDPSPRPTRSSRTSARAP